MPDIGEVVMVQVTNVTDTSAYVKLLEYDDAEGMIPFTELSRRRIRSIGRHAKVGNLEVAMVIRMDREKGYTDLSKRQVTSVERKSCDEKYQRAKIVTNIMRQAAQDSKKPIATCMTKVAWPLYAKYGHAYDALKQAVVKPEILAGLDVDEDIREKVFLIISHKLRAQILKFQTDVHVTCYTKEGIDAIRDVLLAGQAQGKVEPALPVSIVVGAPPIYVVRTATDVKEDGFKKLEDVITVMTEEMKKRNGHVEVVVPPYVLGDDGSELKPDEAVARPVDSSSEEDA